MWLAWLFLALLAGCATAPDNPPEAVPGPPLHEFSAVGRISVRQGDRSEHLQFEWRHAPQSDLVVFSTPLGQGLAELGRDAGGAWLTLPGTEPRRAGGLPELTRLVVGVPLPLGMLADWLRGAQPALEGEAEGWHIVILETMPYDQSRLPRRLDIRRGEVELRIVIDGWGTGG